MRNTITGVALFACAIIFMSTGQVKALSSEQLALTDDPFHYLNQVEKTDHTVKQKPKSDSDKKDKKAEPAEKVETSPPAPVEYTVAEGDSLTKIAIDKQTDWKRLFFKNTQLANPNLISAGQVLTIPTADEQLAERPLPASEVIAAPVANVPNNTSAVSTSRQVARGSSAGNTYVPGYCTWYAKSRRPDLPNRMGNAISWVASAAAQGFATGSAPRAGAIGQQGNHVVYVESVNGDGTVTVSEMNYAGLYIISSRTVAASNFMYIY